jgi:hypothetical protein
MDEITTEVRKNLVWVLTTEHPEGNIFTPLSGTSMWLVGMPCPRCHNRIHPVYGAWCPICDIHFDCK